MQSSFYLQDQPQSIYANGMKTSNEDINNTDKAADHIRSRAQMYILAISSQYYTATECWNLVKPDLLPKTDTSNRDLYQ